MLSNPDHSLLVRTWHGWTSLDDADAYEDLLATTIVPGIVDRAIPGHRSTDILRRSSPESGSGEVEFSTVMVFDGWDAIVAFAGGDGTPSVVPDAARALLSRFDDHSRHYRTVAGFPAYREVTR